MSTLIPAACTESGCCYIVDARGEVTRLRPTRYDYEDAVGPLIDTVYTTDIPRVISYLDNESGRVLDSTIEQDPECP